MIFRNQNNDKYTCVYFDIFGNNYNEFIEKVRNIAQKKKMYIFSLGDYVDETSLIDVKNYTIESIPYKIVELYRKLSKICKEN